MKDIVRCLKALADENRLRILMLLRERELCVFELMGILEFSQPLLSSHLAVLRGAGLVEGRREGRRMRYRISPAAASGGKVGIVRIVADAVKKEMAVVADRTRLRECTTFREGRGSCDRKAVTEFRSRKGKS